MECSRCGYLIDTTQFFCPLCGGIFKSEFINKKSSDTETVPWESSSARDYPLRALLNTIQESFFNVDSFFYKLKNASSIKPALLYGIISGSIGMVATFLWSFFLPDSLINSQNSTVVTANNLIFTPFILSFQILVTTLYIHLMLIIFRSRKAPISATFRLSCYALGALILNAIPALGPFLSSVLWFYLIITGVHQLHSISKWKALAIMIFPLIFFFFVVLLIVLAIGIAGVAAFGLFS